MNIETSLFVSLVMLFLFITIFNVIDECLIKKHSLQSS